MKPGMKQATLPDLLRILSKRKLMVVLSVAVSCLAGMFLIRKQPPSYQARSAVEIEQYFTLSPSGKGYSFTDAATETNIITSLPVMFEVAWRLGRIPRDVTQDEALRNEEYFRAMKTIQSRIRPKARGGTMIIDIEVTSPQPVEARDIADLTAEAYKDHRSLRSKERAEQARAATGDQRLRLEGLLDAAEKELSEYRLSHRLVEPTASLTVHLNRLAELEEREQELMEQENILTKALTALLDESSRRQRPEGGAVDAPPLPTLPAELAASYQQVRQDFLRASMERGELARSLTVSHPDFQDVKARQAALHARLIELLRGMLDETARKREEAAQRRSILDAQRADFTIEQIDLVRLERKVERYQNMVDRMQEAWQATEFEEGYKGDMIRIIERALLPAKPVGNRRSAFFLASVFLGLIVGAGLAFVLESFDFSLDNVAELESWTGLPVLTVVPRFVPPRAAASRNGAGGRGEGKGGPPSRFEEKMVTHFMPKHQVSEGFRILRMAMHLQDGQKSHRVFLVTSATPQEGKSFASSNLAIAFAKSGRTTLLVEANMRRPSFHRIFPVNQERGLSDIATGTAAWRDLVWGTNEMILEAPNVMPMSEFIGLDSLRILPAGKVTAHPAEAIERLAQGGFFQEAREDYEVVVVDCPPVLPVADASILGHLTDGVLLVYRAGRTPRDVLLRGIESLKRSRANLIGLVLNGVDYRGIYSPHKYLYRYQYHQVSRGADAEAQAT